MWRIVICLSLLVVGMIVGLWLANRTSSRPQWTWTGAGLTVEKLKALSELVTVRAEIADVQETKLAGYTGSLKAAVLIRGEFLAGVDLSQARFENKDEIRHAAVLRLPQPHLISAKLDMKRTKVFGISARGLWWFVPGGNDANAVVVNHAYKEAQQVMDSALLTLELAQQARAQAEKVLGEFGKSLGWEVEVKWSE